MAVNQARISGGKSSQASSRVNVCRQRDSMKISSGRILYARKIEFPLLFELMQFTCIQFISNSFKLFLETIRNKESKVSRMWVNIACILHGTMYSIFAYYMRTVQSNFRKTERHKFCILINCNLSSFQSVQPNVASMNFFSKKWNFDSRV